MERRSYKVFISYSRKDAKLARRVAREVEAAGAAALLEEGSPEPGGDVKAGIDRALRGSDEVIVLVTPASRESAWMSFELGAATGLGKRVVPIVQGVGPADLPPALRSFQSVDAKDLSRYVEELRRRAGGD